MEHAQHGPEEHVHLAVPQQPRLQVTALRCRRSFHANLTPNRLHLSRGHDYQTTPSEGENTDGHSAGVVEPEALQQKEGHEVCDKGHYHYNGQCPGIVLTHVDGYSIRGVKLILSMSLVPGRHVHSEPHVLLVLELHLSEDDDTVTPHRGQRRQEHEERCRVQ